MRPTGRFALDELGGVVELKVSLSFDVFKEGRQRKVMRRNRMETMTNIAATPLHPAF